MPTLQKTLEQQLIEELQGLAEALESGEMPAPVAPRQPARKKPGARRNGQVLRRAEAIAEQRQAAARQTALPL